MRKRVRLSRKKLFKLKIMFREDELHSYPTLGLTGEVPAVAEVHLLHSSGKHELVDSACGREGEVRERNTG